MLGVCTVNVHLIDDFYFLPFTFLGVSSLLGVKGNISFQTENSTIPITFLVHLRDYLCEMAKCSGEL